MSTNSQAFFDAVDEATKDDLSTGFEPLPKGIYPVTLSGYDFFTPDAKDKTKVNLEFTVFNDEGYNGRKIWDDRWLDGVDKNGKSMCMSFFGAARFIRGALKCHPHLEDVLLPYPHMDLDTTVAGIPLNDDGEPDLGTWMQIFDTLMNMPFFVDVDQTWKRVKDGNGNWVNSNLLPKEHEHFEAKTNTVKAYLSQEDVDKL